MDRDTKREVIQTLLTSRRIDLANAAAHELKSAPVARYTPEEVTAASLSRIWRHFSTDDVETGVAIVSADRGDRVLNEAGQVDLAANQKANEKMRGKLTSLIRSMGKGFIKTKGGYREEGVGLVYEHSFVIPGVTRAEAVKLARQLGRGAELNGLPAQQKAQKGGAALADQFRQDSILWGNNEAGAFLIFPNGSADKIGTVMKMNNVQDLFTEWKRRRVTFAATACTCESIEYVPTSPSDWRQWRSELSRHAAGA